MYNSKADAQLISMLLDRLERISADSVLAHRASGVRGTLLWIQEQIEHGNPPDVNNLPGILSVAMRILTQAAKRSAK